jgi:hypothetical protein
MRKNILPTNCQQFVAPRVGMYYVGHIPPWNLLGGKLFFALFWSETYDFNTYKKDLDGKKNGTTEPDYFEI